MTTIIDKYYSPALDEETPYMALIPDSLRNAPDKPYVLIVHGMTDTVNTWLRGTRIEKYLENHGFAAALTFAANSYYTDMAHGKRYYTDVAVDFPEFLSREHGFSRSRKKRFIMGNSMGGYGALKLALTSPESYSAAVSLSGVTDLVYRFVDEGAWPEDGVANWGADYKRTLQNSTHDLYRLVRDVEQSGAERPILRQICGTEDYLYPDNQRFREFMLARDGWDYEYTEGRGAHWWDFWNRVLPDVLDFFEYTLHRQVEKENR